MRGKFFIVVGIIFVAAIIVSRFVPMGLSLEAKAANILKECGNKDRIAGCYDQEIEKSVSDLSLEQSFDLIKLIQQKDDSYWFCHTASHLIGAKEYEKNPGDWTEIITRCPVGICSNGCIHGVIQEHFGSESISNSQTGEIVEALKNVCQNKSSWNAAELQTASCYHEMGHAAFLTTSGEVETSASICDRISVVSPVENYLQTCYEGVAMSVFQPLETDDFAIVYEHVPDKTALRECEGLNGEPKSICWRKGWTGMGAVAEFCRQFNGELQYACFRESFVIEGDSLEKAEGIQQYCNYSLDPGEKKKCYNKVFYGLVTRFGFDENKMISLCITFPTAIQGQCFGNTASRLIETDRRLVPRAVEVCSKANSYDSGEDCYQELLYYSVFAFKSGSVEFFDLCNRLPQSWNEKCLAQNR